MPIFQMNSRWGAEIEGDADDVENLAYKINRSIKSESDIFCDTSWGAWVLRSSGWDDLDDPAIVEEYTTQAIGVLVGAMSILDVCADLTVGTIYEFKDGFSPTMTRRTTFKVVIRQTPEGRASPADFERLKRAADHNIFISNCFSLLKPGYTWFSVYMAIEELENFFGGEAKFREQQLLPSTRLRNIKRMANSFRHAGKVHQPPSPPIPLGVCHKEVSAVLRETVRRHF